MPPADLTGEQLDPSQSAGGAVEKHPLPSGCHAPSGHEGELCSGSRLLGMPPECFGNMCMQGLCSQGLLGVPRGTLLPGEKPDPLNRRVKQDGGPLGTRPS
ncbi:hypothetical protein EYF80_061064 [Liparis tanakae]|uniref:Uncharacterized protein n=1 Tax=Liparis tanakae TaxID=230148 RepID=A0A4Z2EJN2_9TELE|nr:hypothetical protein EYF80_061064 [Liparis tanakae]